MEAGFAYNIHYPLPQNGGPPPVESYTLLQEDGFDLLQEDGFLLEVEH